MKRHTYTHTLSENDLRIKVATVNTNTWLLSACKIVYLSVVIDSPRHPPFVHLFHPTAVLDVPSLAFIIFVFASHRTSTFYAALHPFRDRLQTEL